MQFVNDNPFGLAPMAGFSDKAMRQLARQFGCGLQTTEMVSAKALVYGNEKSFNLFDLNGEDDNISVQLFGNDPAIMAEGAKIAVLHGAPAIDINMGCPVPKVVKNGEGSALLQTPKLAFEIVRAVSKAICEPLSVKMRIGWDRPDPKIDDFAKGLADAGATYLCVHGRTRQAYYTGKADWQVIKKVVDAVEIDVLANGDVCDVSSGLDILSQTGAKGAMVGRAAVGTPWLFAQLKAASLGQPIPDDPSLEQRLDLIKAHAKLAILDKGETMAMREMRKIVGTYVKGFYGVVDMRRDLYKMTSFSELESLLARFAQRIHHKQGHIELVNTHCDS